MKTIFKNVNMLAIAGVLITSSALAMSGSTLQSPTHYNANSSSGSPDWQPIPNGYSVDCTASESQLCTAVKIGDNFVPTADRGIAELIEIR
ncbi:hypothetical protein [Sphingobacterium sp.]|nr:hypothetical protein [Sphingobacterium sp.]